MIKFSFVVETYIKNRAYQTETNSLEYAKHLAEKDRKKGHKTILYRKTTELKAIEQ